MPAAVNLDTDGNYTFPAVLSGTYDLAFKANHWLRTVVSGVMVAEGDVTGVNVSLTNGGIDGDNEVTLFDSGRWCRRSAVRLATATGTPTPIWMGTGGHAVRLRHFGKQFWRGRRRVALAGSSVPAPRFSPLPRRYRV